MPPAGFKSGGKEGQGKEEGEKTIGDRHLREGREQGGKGREGRRDGSKRVGEKWKHKSRRGKR